MPLQSLLLSVSLRLIESGQSVRTRQRARRETVTGDTARPLIGYRAYVLALAAAGARP